MRNLGQYFEHLAYEYSLPRAIKEGYLSPIKAVTIPLKLDLTGVGIQAGDFKNSDLDTALDPYLHQIAREMRTYCAQRKTVVFLPLVRTSKSSGTSWSRRGSGPPRSTAAVKTVRKSFGTSTTGSTTCSATPCC